MAGVRNFIDRGKIYKYMLNSKEDKFTLFNKICIDILGAFILVISITVLDFKDS